MDWASEAAKFGGTMQGGTTAPDWASEAAKFGGTVSQAKGNSEIVNSQSDFSKNVDAYLKHGVVHNALGAVAEPVMNLASSAVAYPISRIAGLAALISKNKGDPNASPLGFQNEVQDALTYKPRTSAGAVTTEYNPIALLGKGINAIGGAAGNAIAGDNAADTFRGALGNAVHEVINQAPGVILSSPAARSVIASGAKAVTAPIADAVSSSADAVAGGLRSRAENMMVAALNATPKQKMLGNDVRAAQYLLNNKLNLTKEGVSTVKDNIDTVNSRIGQSIVDSSESVSKNSLLKQLDDMASKAVRQDDITAIQKVRDDIANNPRLGDDIPVQIAQQYKVDTYKALGGKYGQSLPNVTVKAEKAAAMNLKNQIADKVPGIGELNAADSEMYNALPIMERRVLASGGYGGFAWIIHNPKLAATYLIGKSPAFRSFVANALNSGSNLLTGTKRPTLPEVVSKPAMPELSLTDSPLPSSQEAAPPPYRGLLSLADLPYKNESSPTHSLSEIDFPLRQEVLQQPAISKAIDSFRTEAGRLQDILNNKYIIDRRVKARAAQDLSALQAEFGAGMRQLGIENAADAHGLRRPLYEAGRTQLPIQKTYSGR